MANLSTEKRVRAAARRSTSTSARRLQRRMGFINRIHIRIFKQATMS
jgi:hypothetical protein